MDAAVKALMDRLSIVKHIRDRDNMNIGVHHDAIKRLTTAVQLADGEIDQIEMAIATLRWKEQGS